MSAPTLWQIAAAATSADEFKALDTCIRGIDLQLSLDELLDRLRDRAAIVRAGLGRLLE